MYSTILYFNLIISFMSSVQITLAVVTETAQGRLRGLVFETHISYVGVPYASLNISQHRFKRAGPAPQWQGVREAEARCGGGDREECLELDVHVPRGAPTRFHPVLVWIKSSAGVHHPVNLVSRGIVLVVLRYRTGPFGFLCLEDEAAPGNAGAKDVVVGLRWVRDNIAAFRGDPARVVVAGQGFGAAIVDSLTLSSMARGLFHGAIAQSGSALCPWAFNYDAQERARTFIDQFAVHEEDSLLYNSSKLLRAKAEDLRTLARMLKYPYFPFAMCVEKPFKREELFLRKAPADALKSHRAVTVIPLMIGYNANEARVFLDIIRQFKVLERVQKDVTFLIPEELKFINRKEAQEIADKIRDTYFNESISIEELLNYYRDVHFASSVVRSARLHAAVGPVYLYELEGAAHADELHYLFPAPGRDFRDDDALLQERITGLWTDFVHHLKPTLVSNTNEEWEALSAEKPRVYAIGRRIRMRELPRVRALHLWDELYEKHLYLKYDVYGTD